MMNSSKSYVSMLLLLSLLLSSSSFFGGFGSSFVVIGGPIFVEGWGTLGHEIVANIAWNRLSSGKGKKESSSSSLYHYDFVTDNNNNNNNKKKKTSNIQSWIMEILGPLNHTEEAGSPLAAIADWADQVRHYQPWSAPLHFIDVRDDLYKDGCHYHNHHHDQQHVDDSSNITTTTKSSKECYFDYERDCPDNICVAGAIVNYTKQLLILPPDTTTMTTADNNMNDNNKVGSSSKASSTDDDDASATETTTSTYQKVLRGGGGNGDIIEAPADSFSFLSSSSSKSSSSSSSWLKSQALRFVVHFIGDIHQPLHCSRKTDKGGNDFHVHADFMKKPQHVNDNNIAVLGNNKRRDYRNLFLPSTTTTTTASHHHHSWNLHSVWDTGIIEVVMLREYNNSRQLFEQDLLHQSYDIDNDLYKKECGIGLNQSCTILWGQESFKLALQYAYLMPSSSSDTEDISNDDDADDDDESDEEVQNGSTLKENYYESRLPIVKQQLIAAGIRLATTLEAIYNATHNSNNVVMKNENEDISATADVVQHQQGQHALSILTNLRMGFAM